jgi:uncharacterized membrane protein
MKTLLWILQFLLGAYFFAIGLLHFTVPSGLPAPMAWMYDLPNWLHIVSGIAEILGGIGLIVPSLTRIKTLLTPYSAIGLAVVMVGAAIYHIPRGEVLNIIMNLVLVALNAFIAYGRWRLHPIPERGA